MNLLPQRDENEKLIDLLTEPLATQHVDPYLTPNILVQWVF
jgi:hypothetical protein